LIYLDTHVLIWLAGGEGESLSPAARRAIEGEELLVSPAAVLELEFLHEIGRLRPTALGLVAVLTGMAGVRICELPFQAVIEKALRETWGRDPFDRIIVGQAKARSAALVTKDERIRRHYEKAVW
jgi:PIN domain nuclease of toxin-antitoxin system